jgi:glutathione synthase/RimK-type ligase-like ATP-grasp enzyme
MIVLWGLMEDAPLAAVHDHVRRRGAPVIAIDQRRLPSYRFESVLSHGALEGEISWPNGRVDLKDVTAIYARPYDFTQLPAFQAVDCSGEDKDSAVRFEDGMLLWCELTEAVVVNRPSAMASNSSKPYQSELIKNCGFLVPDTLITTDPDRVTKFHDEHGQIIYKSISGRRSIVSKVNDFDLARLAELEACPTQFQEFIPGVDYRVHVLGTQVFCCRIVSDADDYRYASGTTIMRCELATGIQERCKVLAKRLGLRFAGIDLRETPDGQWFCFEVNPSPGYTFFDGCSGELTEALAAHLMARNP